MPKIADAVNAFASEAIQRNAYVALLTAFGLPPSGNEGSSIITAGVTSARAAADDATESGLANSPSPNGDGSQNGDASARRKPGRKATTKKPSYPRIDVNFRPEHGVSLRDFADEKKPANNHERNLLIVYYFEDHLSEQEVTVGQVLAGYRECKWRPPGDPDNSLSKTASLHAWLDTASREAIKTTHKGRSFIEHDMPPETGKKSP